MKVSTLPEALKLLNPARPLSTEHEIQHFFVERSSSPLLDLSLLLQNSDGKMKVLFTGHRGNGKSTELARLALNLKDDFFIVRFGIIETLNMFDLNYVDILLLLGLKLIDVITRDRIPVDHKVLDGVLIFTKDISKEVETGITGGGGVETELNLYAVKLTGKLGAESTTRTTVREAVSRRLSDLLDNIKILARAIKTATQKDVLVIIEDLDKVDLVKAEELFYKNAVSFGAPAVSIIYTFPIALRHGNNFNQIKMNFPEVRTLPNINAFKKDNSHNPDGRKQLRAILTNRVKEDLFEDDALELLAETSGGVPRELLALAQRACLEAMKAKSKINLGTVKEATLARRIEYQNVLTTPQLQLLKAVRDTKRIENDEAHQALLHNLSVLEYRDEDGLWHDVHPVVIPLLSA